MNGVGNVKTGPHSYSITVRECSFAPIVNWISKGEKGKGIIGDRLEGISLFGEYDCCKKGERQIGTVNTDPSTPMGDSGVN